MKKLLLLTNIFCFCILLMSCKNSKQSKTEVVYGVKPAIQDTALASDTSKVVNKTAVSGTTSDGKSTKKDSVNKQNGGKAIIHNSPEQAKIDSIKNAKSKNKK